jgi:hypothetical protein
LLDCLFLLTVALIGSWLFGCLDSGVDAVPTARLRLYANVSGAGIQSLEVTVEGPGEQRSIHDSHVFAVNQGVVNGVMPVSVGPARIVVVRALDRQAAQTHRGFRAVDVQAGVNPTTVIKLTPLSGLDTLEAQLGTTVLLVAPARARLTVLDTTRFTLIRQDSSSDSVIAQADWTASQPERVMVVGGLATPRDTGRVVIRGWAGSVSAVAVLEIEPPTFVGAGDIAMLGGQAEATALLLDSIPGTVFTLGDNTYPWGLADEFANYYDPTWGRHKWRTRPAAGNHDYGDGHRPHDASAYFDYFGPSAGDPDKGYYSFDLANWHIIVLNSEIDLRAGSVQEQWLRADLAAHPSLCTLAYAHNPLFGSGDQGNSLRMLPVWRALYDAGAEVVLAGHDHDYEQFAPQRPDGTADSVRGIREFVIGTGGATLLPFKTIQPNSLVRNVDTHGVLKLTLLGDGYRWRFIPVAGKTFSDSGSAACFR